MYIDLIVYSTTMLLAGFCAITSFCRIANVDMKGVQYRYVAPFVLIFAGSLGVGVSLIGGDRSAWYQPVVLLAFAMYLWNTMIDWKDGMPEHYYRRNRIARSALPRATRHRVVFENAVVAFVVMSAVGVAGAGSAAGRGNPVQIYSAAPKNSVIFPGDDLTILYTMRRLRVCPGYASRFIASQETGEIVQRYENKPIGGTQVGRKMINLPATVPTSALIPPGRYAYRAILYSNCDDANYTQVIPDVPFVMAVRTPPPTSAAKL